MVAGKLKGPKKNMMSHTWKGFECVLDPPRKNFTGEGGRRRIGGRGWRWISEGEFRWRIWFGYGGGGRGLWGGHGWGGVVALVFCEL